MSERHRTKAYATPAKRMRPILQAQIDSGQVVCRRCFKPITTDQAWDVSHIVDAAIAEANGWPVEAINAPDNLAAEHRTCNRSAGGRLSQTMAANKRAGTDLKHGTW